MNSVHDMGGMHGFGPIPREENEPVFHAEWEARMFGINLLTIDSVPAFRFALECLDPVVYLGSSYYERWIPVKERLLTEEGVVTAEEVEARTQHFRSNPGAAVPRREEPGAAERIRKLVRTRRSPVRDVGVASRFKAGDAVVTRNINPPGHTRLPRYVRGKHGVVTKLHGIHDFDDTVAIGASENPQPVYNVRFDAEELWGESAEPNTSLYIDIWESYLEPA